MADIAGKSNPFYKSTKWKRLRDRALRKFAECQVCGWANPNHVDHMDGDASNNDVFNLLPLCSGCHNSKTANVDGFLRLYNIKTYAHAIAYVDRGLLGRWELPDYFIRFCEEVPYAWHKELLQLWESFTYFYANRKHDTPMPEFETIKQRYQMYHLLIVLRLKARRSLDDTGRTAARR